MLFSLKIKNNDFLFVKILIRNRFIFKLHFFSFFFFLFFNGPRADVACYFFSSFLFKNDPQVKRANYKKKKKKRKGVVVVVRDAAGSLIY